jgi:hypothetical protein
VLQGCLHLDWQIPLLLQSNLLSTRPTPVARCHCFRLTDPSTPRFPTRMKLQKCTNLQEKNHETLPPTCDCIVQLYRKQKKLYTLPSQRHSESPPAHNSKTSFTCWDGLSPIPRARFHLANRLNPKHGPYARFMSNCLRISSTSSSLSSSCSSAHSIASHKV